MTTFETFKDGAIAVALVGGVGFVGYLFWKSGGSLDKMTENILTGVGKGTLKAAENLGKTAYKDLVKPGAKQLAKFTVKTGHTIEKKVWQPTEDFFKKDVKGAFNKTGKKIEKAFSRKSMKKSFKKMFRI